MKRDKLRYRMKLYELHDDNLEAAPTDEP